jgi:hypothetical protein
MEHDWSFRTCFGFNLVIILDVDLLGFGFVFGFCFGYLVSFFVLFCLFVLVF